ncbi:hypothetical protein CA983_00480 [Streptomyces swartbergensis]|uniref:Uncharacterized protein n=1 Tax=Streptomyces swartbergensis TaxID=487165 RepID=A0A243SBM8_9ACTN|nr:hypothetical protein CA983_00480 [Streptomyces swartbergensis]
MLRYLAAELLADTREFGPVARNAVVADPAPARVAGQAWVLTRTQAPGPCRRLGPCTVRPPIGGRVIAPGARLG